MGWSRLPAPAPIPAFPQRGKEQDIPRCAMPERAVSDALTLWGRVGVGALPNFSP
jgi:hypothetical protein